MLQAAAPDSRPRSGRHAIYDRAATWTLVAKCAAGPATSARQRWRGRPDGKEHAHAGGKGRRLPAPSPRHSCERRPTPTAQAPHRVPHSWRCPTGTGLKFGLEAMPTTSVTLSDERCPGEHAHSRRSGRLTASGLSQADAHRSQAVLARFGEERKLGRITPELDGKTAWACQEPSSEDQIVAGNESTEPGAVPSPLRRQRRVPDRALTPPGQRAKSARNATTP